MSKQPTDPKPAGNPQETSTHRDSYTIKRGGGTFNIVDTEGSERITLTHKSGANLKLSNKVFSTFSPNDRQDLTWSNNYTTVNGNSFETVKKHRENRTFGNFSVITGSRNFFTDDIATQYVDTLRDIAIAKNSANAGTGVGNNTGAIREAGKDADMQKVMTEKTAELTKLEKQMGEGGNINLLSSKHLLLVAGGAAYNYDTGNTINEGKLVVVGHKRTGDNSYEDVMGSVPLYEENDTSSTSPFGDISINASNKINMQAGSGGFNVQTSGETKLTTTGRLSLGGKQIMIGSNSGGGGKIHMQTDNDIYLKSGATLTANSLKTLIRSSTTMAIVSPTTTIEGDLHIDGNLIVDGNVRITGNIEVLGWAKVHKNIDSLQNIIAAGGIGTDGIEVGTGVQSSGLIQTTNDVLAGSIYLKTHKHNQNNGNDAGGGVKTSSSVV